MPALPGSNRKQRSRQDAGDPGIEPKTAKPAGCRRSRDRTENSEAGRMPALPGSNRKQRSRQDAGDPGIEPKTAKPAGCRRSRDRTENSEA
ncbi:MAG: hypothetical protein K2X77_15475, partial [Candidatus Obscuribacterales bacterium]|nr:hypothetical protein [Candidatus Obscuribacterales bacterium]